MPIDLHHLLHLPELFRLLRNGRHISVEDGGLYLALRQHTEDYSALFEALGFHFRQHSRGFFYFEAGSGELGKEASQFAVFFFVLVESWADAGRDLETAAFDPAGHRLSELPNFSRPSWQQCMEEAGIDRLEALPELVSRLERLGFTRRLSEESFCFRPPAWRFFDLCLAFRPTAEEKPDA